MLGLIIASNGTICLALRNIQNVVGVSVSDCAPHMSSRLKARKVSCAKAQDFRARWAQRGFVGVDALGTI